MTKKWTFVIYGAASDVIAPIFSYYPDSDFICLINKSNPDYMRGISISSSSENFDELLSSSLKNIDKNSTLVFINAAVYTVDELFISHSKDNLNKMIDTGINKCLAVFQIVLSQMLKNRKGRIINLSSFRSKAPTKGAVVYSAIKSFSDIFFKGIGLEYGRFDITSNTISIGFAESKLLDSISDEKKIEFKQKISKRKFLPPKEFMETLNYILLSNYLNSSAIELDGGINLLE
tara:strand:+ start:1558 stop:2256 length:699 start_codon:yes stop_codon:yes gene_type:complete